LKTVLEQNTERLRTAAKVAAAVAGVPPTGAADGGAGAKDGSASASNTLAGGLQNRAKAIDEAKQKAPSQGGAERPAATELQKRQSGATAGETAAKIVAAATQGTQANEADAASSGIQSAASRRVTLELRGAQALRDAALFDFAPAALELQIKERDGTLIARRDLADGGGALALPLSSSSSSLFAEVSLVVQTTWPVPARLVHKRFATIALDSVSKTVRLDLALEFRPQRQFISVAGNSPDDAKVIEVLRLVAFDLNTIFKKPVVETDPAGEFFARFQQMAVMRVDLVSD
jgi:hypothetical protein